MRLYQLLRKQQVTELLQHALLTVGTEMGGYIIDCTADFHCVIAESRQETQKELTYSK